MPPPATNIPHMSVPESRELQLQLDMFWYGRSQEERNAYANILIFLMLSGETVIAPAAFEVIVHDIISNPSTVLPRSAEPEDEFRRSVAIAVMDKLRAVGPCNDQVPWRRLQNYQRRNDLNRSNFRAWIRTVAYRTALDLNRKHDTCVGSGNRRRWVTQVPLEDWDCDKQGMEYFHHQTSLPIRLDIRRQLEIIAQWIGELKPLDYEVFCLRVDDGLAYGEIGHRTGLTTEAVRKRVTRLRSRLIDYLRAVDGPQQFNSEGLTKK